MRRLIRNLGSLTPRPLALWVTVEAVGAGTALLVVAMSAPIDSAIALPFPGVRPDTALTAGLTFWLAFGLVGGLRTRLQPGGGVVTFSLPFIVAGTVLGGPLVGGLMGLVSEFEVRELRTDPWYGIVANHAVGILAGVSAGIVAFGVRSALAALVPGQPQLTFFVVVVLAALAYWSVNVALVIPTQAIKNDLTLGEAARTPDAAFRATSLVEAVLAWNLAASYLAIGWWAPIVIVALVLAVWQAFDRGQALIHDAMTGLFNELGFAPLLNAATRKATAGVRTYALLSLDLDGLWEVNLEHGQAGGDDFLRASAQRMLRAVRVTDAVSRRQNTGDEFAILLDDVADLEAAKRVAQRIQAMVRQPIHLRGRDNAKPIQAGVSIGVVLIERGTTMTALQLVELSERRLQHSKVLKGEIVATGDGPSREEIEEYSYQKNLTRSRPPSWEPVAQSPSN